MKRILLVGALALSASVFTAFCVILLTANAAYFCLSLFARFLPRWVALTPLPGDRTRAVC